MSSNQAVAVAARPPEAGKGSNKERSSGSSSDNNNNNGHGPCIDVVVIGAGAAALSAVRTLLRASCSSSSSTTNTATNAPAIKSIAIVEALPYIGGRIKSTSQFIPGGKHHVDLGAEIIHGFGTALTDVVEENRDRWEGRIDDYISGSGSGRNNEESGPILNNEQQQQSQQNEQQNESQAQLLEEIFIAAQGDGGPQDRPTRDGKYGVYYLPEEDKLLRFDTDDDDFRRLSTVLAEVAKLDLCASSDDDAEDEDDGDDDDKSAQERREADTLESGDGEEDGDARSPSSPPQHAAPPVGPGGGNHDQSQSRPSRRRSSAISLGEHLSAGTNAVPRRMSGLLSAGYANTAGCTNLDQISLQATMNYERHWEENEIEGDARLHPLIGMVGVVEALLGEIERDERVEVLLNWKAERIDWGDKKENDHGKVSVTSTNGTILQADKLIVTVPPPIITSKELKFNPPLPPSKMDAFGMMGMDRAVKVILQFKERVWPEKVQTVISADLVMPEIWFRDFDYWEEEGKEDDTTAGEGKGEGKCEGEGLGGSNDSNRNKQDNGAHEGRRRRCRHCQKKTVHAAVCFLTSEAANNFLRTIDETLQQEQQQLDGHATTCCSSRLEQHLSAEQKLQRRAEIAASIAKDQLSRIFSVDRTLVEQSYISSIMYDWGDVPTICGGYTYPKVDIERHHFSDMAESLDGKLYFAGEATNTGAACTVQAAMETGIRAAEEIMGVRVRHRQQKEPLESGCVDRGQEHKSSK